MNQVAPEQARRGWGAVGAYVLLVLASCAVLNFAGARTGTALPFIIAQATPLLAMLLLLAASPQRREILRRLGAHRSGRWRWYGWAFLLPIPPIALSYVVAAALGLAEYPMEAGYSFGRTLMSLTYGYVLMTALPLLWAFGEEIGWRGFLQGRLVAKLGILPGAAVTGLVWAVWHYPFIVWGDYFGAGSNLVNGTLFTIALVPMSVLFAWLTISSGSLWPAVLFHAGINGARVVWASGFPSTDPASVYVAGEAGAASIVVWAGLAALVAWILRGRSRARNDPHTVTDITGVRTNLDAVPETNT